LFYLRIYPHRLPRSDFLVFSSLQHQHLNLFSDAFRLLYICLFLAPDFVDAMKDQFWCYTPGPFTPPPTAQIAVIYQRPLPLRQKTIYITVHDIQSGHFGYRITAPLGVHESAALLNACLSQMENITGQNRDYQTTAFSSISRRSTRSVPDSVWPKGEGDARTDRRSLVDICQLARE
jgi:hypothetical protein